jgi:ATP-dependent exoDNAse (exonuclease V) beta subunit
MATDHKTRIRALDPRRSFIVQAPAGSGKTEVLTQRFLRLLATVERPESVLAITFTRKATQEMRSRISKRLAEAAAGVVPDKDHERRAVELASEVLRRDHKLGWNLEENPGRLRITTIDGLCVQLLARDPVHGPHWTGVKVLEDAKPLYRDAIRRLFRDIDAIADSQRGEAENARFAQQALVQLLVHFGGDSSRLEILLMEMLDKRSLWKRHLDARHEDLQELLRQRQQRAVDQFRQALGPVTLQEATRLVNRLGFESGAEGDSVQDELLASFRLARLLCTGSLKPRSPRSVSRGLFPDMDESQAPALEALREIYCQWHNESLALEALERMAAWPPLDVALEGESFSDSLLDDARSVLWLALYELDAVIGESGQADFTAVSDAAVESLGSEALPSDVMLAEDRRIDHILMDEFQDTSFSQFRLLTGLISGWQAGDGRTLFLVGDPMQSIYRFREANVGFFSRPDRR